MAQRRALMVRGGWPGHEPAESVAAVRPLLEARDVDVTVSDSLDSYLDPGLGEFDLIVQCWTMGRITIEQVTGLRAAVASGTGFAGWHGGIADSFRSREEYLQLVGGQYVAHPDGFVTYRIDIVDDPGLPGAGITDGLGPSFEIETEQYWVITDDYNDVLATTTIRPGPHTPGGAR